MSFTRTRFYTLLWHLSCVVLSKIMAKEYSWYPIPSIPPSSRSSVALAAHQVRTRFRRCLNCHVVDVCCCMTWRPTLSQCHVRLQRNKFLETVKLGAHLEQQWSAFASQLCADHEELSVKLVRLFFAAINVLRISASRRKQLLTVSTSRCFKGNNWREKAKD